MSMTATSDRCAACFRRLSGQVAAEATTTSMSSSRASTASSAPRSRPGSAMTISRIIAGRPLRVLTLVYRRALFSPLQAAA
jgi:hypothetical protein